MTQAKTVKKKSFEIPSGTVTVEFIKRQRGNITNDKHVLFGGMSEDAKRRLVPRRSKTTFKYIQILTDLEQQYLENKLALPEDGLSVYKTKDNFWSNIAVDLTKEGVTLNLADPIDYIKYKIVLSYENLVASSLKELKRINKATFRFVIVKPGDKSDIVLTSYNAKKEAYKIANELELDTDKIKEFLFIAGTKSVLSADMKFLRQKLAEMVEEEPERVVEIGSSTDYPTRALIARGVLTGVIKESNGRYQLEDGIELAEQGEAPSLANAIKYLSNPTNSDVKLRIESKIGK